MKKLIVTAFACVGLAASGVERLNPDTCTEADIRAALAEVLATSDGWLRCGQTNGLWQILTRPVASSVRHEADERLADKGYAPLDWWRLPVLFPRLSELARAKTGADKAYVKSIAIAKRLNADVGIMGFLLAGGTFDDVSIMLSEILAFPERCSLDIFTIESYKKCMQKYAIKPIRKHIRSQGKSFVTKDGVNPCETYMTALTTALNAPRFAGLDAWYKSVGLAGVDLSALPSEAEVAELKREVLDGEKDMTTRNQAILYVCLGVDGYNAFVKEYNGDKE